MANKEVDYSDKELQEALKVRRRNLELVGGYGVMLGLVHGILALILSKVLAWLLPDDTWGWNLLYTGLLFTFGLSSGSLICRVCKKIAIHILKDEVKELDARYYIVFGDSAKLPEYGFKVTPNHAKKVAEKVNKEMEK